jgi:16S rRNA (cytidine1402-2'-O)-methyltransferase
MPAGTRQRFSRCHAGRILRKCVLARSDPEQDAQQHREPARCASWLAAKRNVRHAGSLEMRLNESVADSTGRPRAGTLFVVATPIGNLQDLSPRAAACLRDSPLLLAEDTRHTRHLLDASGIARVASSIESLHEHNEHDRAPQVVARLLAGDDVALVSDAGTPLVSDPGSLLVAAAARAGVSVVAVPGPCAAIVALSVAALPTERFAFEGFLPAKSTARRKALQRLVAESRTLVFYEAPHRLVETLSDMALVLGLAREASVARELTKKFESVYRGTLGSLEAQSRVDCRHGAR